jgi:glycine/D-amino acid oxidase-like deaminating enzyme
MTAMAGDAVLAPGWRDAPYWWDAAPREPPAPVALPARADVVIVGAGFTGLAAALVLARAGRGVLVLDAAAPGAGASSRNGGMIGSGHRLSYQALAGRHGEAVADAVIREGLQALAFTTALIAREGIGCGFVRCGRFRGAWRPADYEAMARESAFLRRRFGLAIEMVPRAEQEREVATARYHGGCVYLEHGGLHPGLLHQGLLERARAAGAQVIGHAPVRALAPDGAMHRVASAAGVVEARAVVVATNGHTGAATPALRARLAPVPSFLIATEPLGPERVRALLPGGRMVVESRAAHCYYRASPDGTRLLLGGRAALHPRPPARAARRLHAWLTDLFPQLAGVRLSHAWTGNVAFTRAGLPALGVRDGVHYALGYCGSGVAMAPYLGDRIARQLLGQADGRTAFDALPFAPWPLARALPLARPLLSAWHRLKDWRDGSP